MVRTIYIVFTLLTLHVLMAHTAIAGEYIYLSTEKYVYPYPMEDPIVVMGYLRGLAPGAPVNIRVSLELPGGNVTYLDPGLEFHPGSRYLVEDFPFVSMPVSKLFEITPGYVYNGRPSSYPGQQLTEFMPGKYVLRTEISGGGISDRSEVPFWVMASELLPSIADTPRPIIQEVVPPHGKEGDEITITGLNLRGDPGVVDPLLLDEMLVRVTIGDRAQVCTYLADNGTLLRFRLLPNTKSGDLKVHLVLPYWVEDPEATGHLSIPRVVEVTSNPWPFYMEPVITSISPVDFSPGDSIEISGRNFAAEPGLNNVLFSGVPGTVTDSTNTTLTVLVPSLAGVGGPGGVQVQVVSNGVKGPTYLSGYSPFKIYSVYPVRVAPGDTLKVYGMGFGADSGSVAAYLGGYVLGVDGANDTALTLTLPSSVVHGQYRLRVVVAGNEVQFNEKIEVVPSW